jgi:transcriptional regulator with XRE-family HTH domain
MKMRDWMEESGATVIRAASVLRVSDQTIRNLLNGKGPSPKTLKKLQEVFADYPPTVRFEPTGDPEVIGQLPAQPTPPQAAAYLQKTIATWMKSQSLDHDMAAHELSIKKKVLLNILQLKLPNPVVIGKIIRRIPELRPDHKPLLAARKMLENQRAKAA